MQSQLSVQYNDSSNTPLVAPASTSKSGGAPSEASHYFPVPPPHLLHSSSPTAFVLHRHSRVFGNQLVDYVQQVAVIPELPNVAGWEGGLGDVVLPDVVAVLFGDVERETCPFEIPDLKKDLLPLVEVEVVEGFQNGYYMLHRLPFDRTLVTMSLSMYFGSVRSISGSNTRLRRAGSSLNFELSRRTCLHLLSSSLMTVNVLRDKLSSYSRLDLLYRNAFLDALSTSSFLSSSPPSAADVAPPIQTGVSKKIISSAFADVARVEESAVKKRLQSPVPYVEFFHAVEPLSGGSSINSKRDWFKARLIVDEAPELVLEYIWNCCSYERMSGGTEFNAHFKQSCESSTLPHTLLVSEIIDLPFPHLSRFRERVCCYERTPTGFVLCFAPLQWLEKDLTGGEGLTSATWALTERCAKCFSWGCYVLEMVGQRLTRLTAYRYDEVDGLSDTTELQHPERYRREFMEVLKKFKRHSKDVDRENRDMFISEVQSNNPVLSGEQAASLNELYASLRSRYDAIDNCPSSPTQGIGVGQNISIGSPSSRAGDAAINIELSRMSNCKTKEKRNCFRKERNSNETEGVGKVDCLVDASAIEACAYLFQFCSRARTKNGIVTNGEVVRFQLSKNGLSEEIVVALSDSPTNGYVESVSRLLWTAAPGNCYIVSIEPIKNMGPVDYGTDHEPQFYGKKRIGRSSFKACIFLRPVNNVEMEDTRAIVDDSSCSCTCYFEIVGGESSENIAYEVLRDLRACFQRDHLFEERLAKRIIDDFAVASSATKEEHVLFVDGITTECSRKISGKVISIDAAHHLLKFSRGKTAGRGGLRGRRSAFSEESRVLMIEATIDASPERTANFFASPTSRALSSELEKCGVRILPNSIRSVSRRLVAFDVTPHSSRYVVNGGGTFQTAWLRKENGAVTVAVDSVRPPEGGPPLRSRIRASINIMRASLTAPTANDSEISKVTITALRSNFISDAGLSSDQTLVNAAVKFMENVRNRFDRSSEIDKYERDCFMRNLGNFGRIENTMANPNSVFIQKMMVTVEEFDGYVVKKKRQRRRIGWDLSFDGKKHWLRTRAKVRTSSEQLVSFLWLTKARNQFKEDTIEKTTLVSESFASEIEYVVKKFPPPIINRSFCSRKILTTVSDGVLALFNEPTESVLRPRNRGGTVRGEAYGIYLFEASKESSDLTQIEMISHVNFGGRVPAFVESRIQNAQKMRVQVAQEYFACQLTMSDLRKEDGELLGDIFIERSYKLVRKMRTWTDKLKAVKNVIDGFAALKEFQAKHEWFHEAITSVCEHKLISASDASARALSTQESDLSSSQGRAIGAAFTPNLMTAITVETAVDSWIHSSYALQEIDAREKWFRGFSCSVGDYIFKESFWGLKARAVGGTLFSILDTVSDIYTIFLYRSQGKYSFMWAIVVFCMFNSLANLLILALRLSLAKSKTSKKRIALHLLLAVTGLRHAFLQFSSMSRDDVISEKDTGISVQVEMLAMKTGELFFESLPGGVLQSYVFVVNKQKTAGALFSILMSAASSGVISASISFDLDADPKNRSAHPDFFGYLPDASSERTRCFVSIFAISFSNFILKCTAMALFLSLSWVYFLGYAIVDQLLYLLYRFARNDLRYWPSFFQGVKGWVLSIYARVQMKVINDFVACVQFRHPHEIGGIMWSFGLLQNQLFCAIAAALYLELHDDDDSALEPKHVVPILLFLQTIFLFSFATLMRAINQDYVWTFFDVASAKDATVRHFETEILDENKFQIFHDHPSYFKTISSDVKEWVDANWHSWTLNRPHWFVEEMVPAEFLPELLPSEVDEKHSLRYKRND